MDDRRFDRKSAKEWMTMIESPEAQKRRAEVTYPKIEKWLEKIKPQNLLDMGAGQGACSSLVDQLACQYVGLEPSEVLLNRARELYPQKNKTFIQGSLYEMPFADHSFDAALALAVWHLLEDLSQAAHELSRVLKKNGSFLIATANPKQYSEWIALYPSSSLVGHRLEGRLPSADGDWITDILFLHSMDEIQKSLQFKSLHVDQVEDVGRFVWIYGRKI